jgi:hypothetical protein
MVRDILSTLSAAGRTGFLIGAFVGFIWLIANGHTTRGGGIVSWILILICGFIGAKIGWLPQITSLVATLFLAALVYTLWTGKMWLKWLKRRGQPVIRSEQPLEYWLLTAVLALITGVVLSRAVH